MPVRAPAGDLEPSIRQAHNVMPRASLTAQSVSSAPSRSPLDRIRNRKAAAEAAKEEQLRRAREQAYLDRLHLQSRFADHIRRPGAQHVAGVLRSSSGPLDGDPGGGDPEDRALTSSTRF